MIEVFKTNVRIEHQAIGLIQLIHKTFEGYKANFDLQDRDRILRVESNDELINSSELILLLNRLGFSIEILADEVPFSFPEILVN
ncbi:hypothetical protein C3K47_08005 [Solitalea longa]|uniref:Uncharacterized protein n=1 Tax=Solitalea longa TaxID=2079460 RepID=A0A2S5A3A2_9SPHI|nr:hypothetical protein [Solitalea longa]POY36994.1 hypothetical protein C3K47_08005 [Solitalea longa]